MTDSKCQQRSCNCQRFRAARDGHDDCLFCTHSIGFHEFMNVDTREYPYGKCETCFCQRFKEGRDDVLRCHYCGHYEGFHVSWPITSSIANFSPTQQQQSTSPTENTSRNNVGRPLADKLIISQLICFDKVKLNKIPKERTTTWFKLKSENLIVENVEFSQTDTPEGICNKIRNLFGGRFQAFQLYNAKSGKPVVVEDGFSFDSIKSNMTKTNKKLYVGPSIDSPSEAISNETTSVPLHATGSNTLSEIQKLPLQSSNDPLVRQFFNGSDL